ADLLGIDPIRAGTDYGDIGSEIDVSELDAVFVGTEQPGHGARKPWQPQSLRLHSESNDDEQDGGRPSSRPVSGGFGANILKMLGLGGKPPPADPQVQQLVDAAAANDLAEIDRLVAAGADIEGQAALKQRAPSTSSPMRTLMISVTGLSVP